MDERIHGVVLWGHDRGNADKVIGVFSEEKGLLNLFLPQARRGKSVTGFFLPGAAVELTIYLKESGWYVVQVDGYLLTNTLTWLYEEWQSYYFLVRWIQELFIEGEREVQLYALLKNFFLLSEKKNKSILVMIACWQISVFAGYNPEEILIKKAEIPLSEDGRSLLKWMLKYQWDDSSISISKQTLRELHRTFWYYANVYIGCDMNKIGNLSKELLTR